MERSWICFEIQFYKSSFSRQKDQSCCFLTRLETDTNDKTILKTGEDVPTQRIEVNVESIGVAQEDWAFSHSKDSKLPSKGQLCEQKQEKRFNIQAEPPVKTESHCPKNDKYTDTLMNNMEPFNETHRILLKQDASPVLVNFKGQMLEIFSDERNIATNPRYNHYCRNRNRIKIKDNISYSQYHNDVRKIIYLQVLLSVQLKDTIFNSSHCEAENYPGISKKMQEIRQKLISVNGEPSSQMGEKCQTCVQDNLIDNSQITRDFVIIPEWDLDPEDVMHIHLLPEIWLIGGYQNKIKAIQVFSRYVFAYSVSKPTIISRAKINIDILTRHACLPILMITHNNSAFFANVIHEIVKIFGITLLHETTEDAQSIGVLETTNAALRAPVEVSSGNFREQWHKYVQPAFLNYNTTYDTIIGCEPTRMFHGRIPYGIPAHKLWRKFRTGSVPTTSFRDEIFRKTWLLYIKTKKS